jgi:hypothetical protein
MGGLFIATFLTLMFLPSLYAMWYRKRLGERGGEPDQAPDRLEREGPSAAGALATAA